jgi:hypothetical protein
MYDWPALGVAQDKFGFGMFAGGSWQGVSSTTSPESGVWYHIAAVKDNSTLKIYVNGTLENTATISGSPANGGVVGIGANTNALGGSVKGYLADVRAIISSSSSSLPYTSDFTPPTERLTAVTDTQILACHLPYIVDGSTNSHSITVNGNTKTVPFSPFDYETYSATNNGGSMYFDGTGDYIGAQTSTAGTGDFTLEAWVYRTATGGTWQSVIAQRNGGTSTASQFSWGIHSSGYVYFFAGAHYASTPAGVIGLNRWHHIACTRSGTTVKQFVDGVEKISGTSSNNLSYNQLTIAANYTGIEPFTGIISDPRVVFGTSVYNSAFTPPTSPLTAVTNTEILVKGTNAGIIDKSQSVKTLTLAGDTKSSTTQTKYLSSSMYFDESGDTLTLTSDTPFFGSGDWTFEGWFYFTSVNKSDWQYIFDGRNNGSNYFAQESNNAWRWNSGSGAAISTGLTSSTFSNSTWYHFAVSRESGTLRVFVDGTYTGGGADSSSYGTDNLVIGGRYTTPPNNFGMYVQDLRITKGLARYTSNFTPPAAALQG